jgi:iron complex transport system ATP-binding protein
MKVNINNICFSYGEAEILHDISFSMNEGEILCLLGPNGTGKSTLIKCLARVLPPTAGEIMIDSKDIRTLPRRAFARNLAYIPQSSAPVFPFLVRDLVAMGRTPHKSFFSSPNKSDYKLVEKVLDDLGISYLEYKSCTDLSGGERQLVMFATAIVQEPKILLLDEPTSHLDFGNQMKVLKVIKKLAAEGMSVIMATHAPEHAFLAGNSAALIKHGRLVKMGTPEEVITEQNISSVFGIKIKIVDVDINRNIKTCVPLLN